MIKAFILIFMAALVLKAQQTGTPVQVIPYPQDQPTVVMDYDGSGNLIYVGYAVSKQPAFSWTRAASTLTSIVVATNVGTVTTSTAHGLLVGNPVTVAGSSTSAINATYKIATVPSSTTFTITTSGVSDGTYNDSGMTMSTTAPRTTAAIWSIFCANYTSGNQTAGQWAAGTPKAYTKIWANRATTTCQ